MNNKWCFVVTSNIIYYMFKGILRWKRANRVRPDSNFVSHYEEGYGKIVNFLRLDSQSTYRTPLDLYSMTLIEWTHIQFDEFKTQEKCKLLTYNLMRLTENFLWTQENRVISMTQRTPIEKCIFKEIHELSSKQRLR